jgi:hypothetical protein
MNPYFLAVTAATCLTGFPIEGFGGVLDYQCVVVEVRSLSRNGKLEAFERSPYIGKRFAVDRRDGKVIGADFSFSLERPTVMAPGNASNSFVVTWVVPARNTGVHFHFLWVEEYQQGPRKPFALSGGGFIVSGMCE